MIKHITIDLWGTLIKSNPAYGRSKAQYLKTKFSLPHSTEEILKIWRRVDRYFTERDMKTGKHGLLEDRLLSILSVLGISPMIAGDLIELHGDLIDLFREYPPVPYDDTILATVDKMVGMVDTVGIISNTGTMEGNVLVPLLRSMGMPEFDYRVFSDVCGFSKPNPRIFAQAVEYATSKESESISTDNFLHIGDDLVADGTGARRSGFGYFIVNSEYTMADVIPFIEKHNKT